jgi:Protein of unknown function (DUF4058)
MKSRFPGMNPYLEDPAFWPEFHHKFINYWQEQIADVLPDNYEARLDENIYLVEGHLETKKLTGPDVALFRSRRRKSTGSRAAAGTATLAPVSVPLVILDEQRQAYIKLLHRPSRTVVAVMELLSPANKNEPNRREYLAKRNGLLGQKVHVVELDLLIMGQRVPLGAPLPEADYYYFASRADQRPKCDVYAWALADCLPTVPVPLVAPDADVLCDLSAVFATTYQRGRFEKAIDYRKAPPVPFSAERRQWVRQQVGSANAR